MLCNPTCVVPSLCLQKAELRTRKLMHQLGWSIFHLLLLLQVAGASPAACSHDRAEAREGEVGFAAAPKPLSQPGMPGSLRGMHSKGLKLELAWAQGGEGQWGAAAGRGCSSSASIPLCWRCPVSKAMARQEPGVPVAPSPAQCSSAAPPCPAVPCDILLPSPS